MRKFLLFFMLLFAPMFVAAQAVPPQTHSVTLNWQPSTSTTVTHYGVFRATVSGGPYTYIGFTKGLTYVNTKNPDGTPLADGAIFFYVVVAFTDVDPTTGHSLHSVDSNQVQVTIPITVVIAPATNVTAVTN